MSIFKHRVPAAGKMRRIPADCLEEGAPSFGSGWGGVQEQSSKGCGGQPSKQHSLSLTLQTGWELLSASWDK